MRISSTQKDLHKLINGMSSYEIKRIVDGSRSFRNCPGNDPRFIDGPDGLINTLEERAGVTIIIIPD